MGQSDNGTDCPISLIINAKNPKKQPEESARGIRVRRNKKTWRSSRLTLGIPTIVTFMT
jgi:hypothetical protein